MSIVQKFNDATHSKVWINFVTHAPLATAIVLWFHTWLAFAIAATIGIWKDIIIDVRLGKSTESDAIIAAGFYVLGASAGALKVWL